jgi:hypothetical protein
MLSTELDTVKGQLKIKEEEKKEIYLREERI